MSRSAQPDWILIEQFGHTTDPTVIAIGQTAKTFTPLERVIKSKSHLTVILTALESMQHEDSPSRKDFAQSGTRYILEPRTDLSGWTPAVLVHYGPADGEPPIDPPACGAWHFNVTQGTAHGSVELLDMYQTPEDQRQNGRPLHEAFLRLVGHDHEALQKLVEKKPGVTHQAFETVETDATDTLESGRWIAHYSCRFVKHDDTGEVILHGVTRQCGPWTPGTQAPDPQTLTTQVSTQVPIPGLFRLIIDPEGGNILRTYGETPPTVPPGASKLRDLLVSDSTTDHALDHIKAVAKSELPLAEVTTTGRTGDEARVRIDPIKVGEKTAALVTYWFGDALH